MTYRVALTSYEGPLDLLLQLVEKQKLPVTSVSIAAVTRQYLAYLEDLEEVSPENLNWFIELATKLLYAKSQALLPGMPTKELDAAQEIEGALARYQEYKILSRALEKRLQNTPSLAVRPAPMQPDAADFIPGNISLDVLNAAYQKIMRRLPAIQDSAVINLLPSVEEVCRRITSRIRRQGSLPLESLLEPAANRLELVLVFVALLELTKSGALFLEQPGQFQVINVVAA